MKITLSNKEFELDNLNNEQEAKLAEFLSAMQTEDDPFNIREGDEYWFVSADGSICSRIYSNNITDMDLFKNGNACKDKELLKQLESRAVLTRLMQIYSIRHGGRKLLNKEAWHNDDIGKYFCFFDERSNGWKTDWRCRYCDNGVYFIDEQTAKNCIKDVIKPYCAAHPEVGYN